MPYNPTGPASALRASSDVALNNPTDTQVLSYNASLGKWQNQTAPTAAAATTAAAGILQLAGDLTGTATAPIVAKLNGTSVPATPTAGQVLTATSATAASWQVPTTTGAQALGTTAVQTANYTATAGDLVPVDATSGSITITLPTSPVDKTRLAVKRIDGSTNTVTVVTAGSDVFNKAGGGVSLPLTLQNQSINLQYAQSAAIWYIVGDDLPLSQLDNRYVSQASTTAFNGVLTGSRFPTSGDGVDGDMWLNDSNTSAMTLVGPKVSGSWPSTVLATLGGSQGAALIDAGSWTASTNYTTGQVITAPDGNRYVAPANLTTPSTFTASGWTLLGKTYFVERVINNSFTLAITDIGKVIMVGSSAFQVTMPTDANVPIPVGASGYIVQGGTNQITFNTQSGMSLRVFGSAITQGQWSAIQWIKTGTTETMIINMGLGGGAATANVIRYTTPGTYTYGLPAGAKTVYIKAIGGGGGGGSGARGTAASVPTGGAGGGGASMAEATLPASTLASSITVVVGSGGAGAAAVTTDSTAGAAGTTGGKSYFGTYVTSYASTGNGGVGGGAGGFATVAGGGIGSNGGMWPSGSGASSLANGGSPANAAAAQAGGGGGAGGGISSAGVATAGSNGGLSYTGAQTGSTGGAIATAGMDGTATGSDQAGAGGGGGGSGAAANAGNGGNGSTYGAGGGGGGAALNGFTSGAGGAGSSGMVLVVAEF